ncbi:RNA polymerase-associated protein rtf1 [Malassezia sp. CBS 17886]|nr:RNA polymerase-associated protein rtf1 [Malassezia sp. CBS 17886]
MSEDGLDEELIALVGEDTSSPRSRARSPGAEARATRRSELLGDLSDDASSDEPDAAPVYPLDGIYKDEEDRRWLLSMNELEREEVLAQRRDEISQRHQQAQLAAMVRSQQAAAGRTQRGAGGARKTERTGDAERARRRKRTHEQARRELEDLGDPFAEEDVFRESDESDLDTPRTGAAAKAARLSELRRLRQERADGTGRRAGDDDAPKRRRRRAPSDSDAYESESEYEELSAYRRGVRGVSPVLMGLVEDGPPLELLNACRVGRDELERLAFLPGGDEVIRGCFVRCSWGMRERVGGAGKEHVYRVHQITSVVQREGKFYDLSADRSGRWMNAYITFQWNGTEHTVDLRPLSAQPITASERERWIAAHKGAGALFPSGAAVEAKQRQLETALSAPLTEEDVKAIIERKRALRAAAETNGIGAAASVPQPSGVRIDERTMARLNERNRREDRERIQDAERRAARAKRRVHAERADAPRPRAPIIDVAAVLATAPPDTALVPTIDVDLGDF